MSFPDLSRKQGRRNHKERSICSSGIDVRDGTNWSERAKGSEFRVVWWLSRGKKEGRERRKSFFFIA